MTTQDSPEAAPPHAQRRSPLRPIAAGICLVLSFILTIPAVVGFWGQRTLTDSQRYLATVGPIASDPAVRAAVADVVNKNLQEKLDVKALMQEWLPEKAQPLAAPMAGAINSFISKEVEAFIDSEAFSQLWIAANAQAQKALIGALSANPEGPVKIEGDKVVLDLGELIAEVKDRLVAKGLTVLENVPVPEAADREIVLLQSEQLAKARLIYAFSIPIARWLIVAVLLFALGAILLARRRARMVVTVGALLIVSMIILRMGLKAAETYLSASTTDAVVGAAATAFFDHLTHYLIIALRTGYMIGLVMIVLGWLFGRSSSALASRQALARAITGAGAKAGATGSVARAGAWVAPKRVALMGAVVTVAGIFLIMADPLTAGRVLLLTGLVIAGVLAIQVLAASAPPPDSAAANPDATDGQDDVQQDAQQPVSPTG